MPDRLDPGMEYDRPAAARQSTRPSGLSYRSAVVTLLRQANRPGKLWSAVLSDTPSAGSDAGLAPCR
ncbi:hypothetical protein GCM10010298_68210 [Streptomyces microflavus]|nr:hypothetical protein GCM10010298_68210 [Streptomyces microflavus]